MNAKALVEAAKAFDVVLADIGLEMGGASDKEALKAVLDAREVMHALAGEDPAASSHEALLKMTKRAVGEKSLKKIDPSWADPIIEYVRSRGRVTTEEVLINAIGKKRADIGPRDIHKAAAVLYHMGWVRKKIRMENSPTAQRRVFERPDFVQNGPDLPRRRRSQSQSARQRRRPG